MIRIIKEDFNEFDEDDVLDMALMSYESGHNFERSDFSSDERYQEYVELMEMGPAGFYDEYKDELDFSDDFVSEFGDYYD